MNFKNVTFIVMILFAFSFFIGCATEAESKETVVEENQGPASEEAQSVVVSTGEAMTVSFDDLPAGVQIDSADPSWMTEKVNGTTVIANVSADMSVSPSQSLYLADMDGSAKPYAYKEFASGPAGEGSISFYAYIPSDNAKSFYANVGLSKNNADRYVEFKISQGGTVYYEYGSEDEVVGSVVMDSWVFCKIAWTAEGTFDIYVGDEVTPVASDIPVYGDFTANYPTQATFYCGDNGSTGTVVYIDDISSTLF